VVTPSNQIYAIMRKRLLLILILFLLDSNLYAQVKSNFDFVDSNPQSKLFIDCENYFRISQRKAGLDELYTVDNGLLNIDELGLFSLIPDQVSLTRLKKSNRIVMEKEVVDFPFPEIRYFTTDGSNYSTNVTKKDYRPSTDYPPSYFNEFSISAESKPLEIEFIFSKEIQNTLERALLVDSKNISNHLEYYVEVTQYRGGSSINSEKYEGLRFDLKKFSLKKEDGFSINLNLRLLNSWGDLIQGARVLFSLKYE
jgi:hypothetical protein